MASGCLTTLGLLLTSFAPNIYVIYFGYGVLTGRYMLLSEYHFINGSFGAKKMLRS